MKIEQRSDGGCVVIEEGEVIAENGAKQNGIVRRWDLGAGQIEAHMQGRASADHPFRSLKAGDVSAARDAANEAMKQRNS